ncbi:MAG: hypothetical protein VX421_11360 [Pseudomonadota bacterium]|nr:hypothetical protein [Pseudomonadota bacterium]
MGLRALLLMALLGLVSADACAESSAPLPEEIRSGLALFRQAEGVGIHLGEARQQALYRKAESARSEGRTDDAGRILAGMKEGYWTALGYLNLATDYARTDLNPARALVALRVALAMAEGDPLAQRRDHLRNNLLVRAGYLAYQHGEFDKAIGFLEKEDLDSFSTPRALYLHGLALAEKGNHRAAMQSWHRARKYPLAYPGVADAWIGMGRGYDLSGYLGQSGEAYLAANAAFESERVTLRKLAEKIEQSGAYKTLILDARDTGVDWFLADSRTLTQPRMAYLLAFMEQPDAQQAAGRVAELEARKRQLEGFGRDLEVFQKALESALVDASSGAVGDDGAAERLVQQGEALLARLERLGASAGNEQTNRLQALRTTIADARSRLELLQGRATIRPAVLEALAGEARALHRQNRKLLASVGQLSGKAAQALDELALAFVRQQDQRMTYALDKTEQQIAHLYEYLALQNLGETSQ